MLIFILSFLGFLIIYGLYRLNLLNQDGFIFILSILLFIDFIALI